MRRPSLLRLCLGIAVSIVFLGITLSRVDLAATGAAITAAAPHVIVIALVVVLVDVTLRALRWKGLLDPLPATRCVPTLRLCVGYLSIGYLANAVLPARLGDVGRAYVAGGEFGIPRLTVLGTIVVERVADGLSMLGLAAVSMVALSAAAGLGDLIATAVLGVAAGGVVLLLGWAVLARTRVGTSRAETLIRTFLARLGGGASALHEPRRLATFVLLTGVLAGTSLVVAWLVTIAVGLRLAPFEMALLIGGVALALAIPAAPGGLGTYEFVGTTVITSLGHAPELGLATVLLMRLLTTVPPVVMGAVAALVLHVRADELQTDTPTLARA